MGVVWGVGRLGFEPRTLGLKVRCSDQTELPARRGMPVSRARLRLAGRLSGHGASFYYTTNPSSGWLRCGGSGLLGGEEGGFQTRPYGVRGEGGHVGPPLRTGGTPYGREVRRDDQRPAGGHVVRPYRHMAVRRPGEVGRTRGDRPYGVRDGEAGGHVGPPLRSEGIWRADTWSGGPAPTVPGSPTGRWAPGGRTRGSAPTV